LQGIGAFLGRRDVFGTGTYGSNLYQNWAEGEPLMSTVMADSATASGISGALCGVRYLDKFWWVQGAPTCSGSQDV
jgi:hypothetical protein